MLQMHLRPPLQFLDAHETHKCAVRAKGTIFGVKTWWYIKLPLCVERYTHGQQSLHTCAHVM
jgi:hypothetical protein